MMNFFNDILRGYQYFVDALFTKFEYDGGMSIGWILLTITLIYFAVRFLYGRFGK